MVQAPMEVDNILKHGVNNAVLLLDVVLSRIPFVSYHYQVVCRGYCSRPLAQPSAALPSCSLMFGG